MSAEFCRNQPGRPGPKTSRRDHARVLWLPFTTPSLRIWYSPLRSLASESALNWMVNSWWKCIWTKISRQLSNTRLASRANLYCFFVTKCIVFICRWTHLCQFTKNWQEGKLLLSSPNHICNKRVFHKCIIEKKCVVLFGGVAGEGEKNTKRNFKVVYYKCKYTETSWSYKKNYNKNHQLTNIVCSLSNITIQYTLH